MPTGRTLLPLPPSNQMTDASGKLTPEWRRYLESLDKLVRALNT